MYRCFECDEFRDNDYDPMDDDGVCNDCVDNRPEGAEVVRVVMTSSPTSPG